MQDFYLVREGKGLLGRSGQWTIHHLAIEFRRFASLLRIRRVGIDEGQVQCGVGPVTFSSLIEEFDRCLAAINIEYASKRGSGRLAPVVLNVLPAGWLADLDRRLAGRQRHANEQFKHRYLYGQLEEDQGFPVACGEVGEADRQLSPGTT